MSQESDDPPQSLGGEHLPVDDVVNIIWSLLRPLSLLLLRSVSRRWADEILLSFSEIDVSFEAHCHSLPHKLLSRMRNLQSLNTFEYECPKESLILLTNLTSLTPNDAIDDEILTAFTRLEALSLFRHPAVTDSGLSWLTRLEVIDLDANSLITDRSLSCLTGLKSSVSPIMKTSRTRRYLTSHHSISCNWSELIMYLENH